MQRTFWAPRRAGPGEASRPGAGRRLAAIALAVASLDGLATVSRLAHQRGPTLLRLAPTPPPPSVSPTTATTVPPAPAPAPGPGPGPAPAPVALPAAGPARPTASPSGSPDGPAAAPTTSTIPPTPGPAAPRPAPVTTVPPAPAVQATSCEDSDCVILDGTSPAGPVDYAGAGLNSSVAPGVNDDVAAMRDLRNQMFRGGPRLGLYGQYDWSSWDEVASAGGQMVLVLSDLWDRPGPLGYHATPWSDWAAYSAWVRGTVGAILATGRRVDYWDVYNEPGWNDGYYSPADFQAETPDDLLQQFLIAYQAIKSVAPRAAVIGPSTGLWSLSPLPPNNLTHEPDLGTFIRFAASHGIDLAAVAWHDNGSPPATIRADADATWALMRSLPSLGHPAMFLDEYGSRTTQPIPGYDVGFLAALADSGITMAARSCWDTCDGPQLDGLLGDDGFAKTPEYFDRLTYAHMSGQRVASRTGDSSLFATGSVDPGQRRLVALIGRAAGCGPSSACRPVSPFAPDTTPAVPVRVTAVVPWTSASPPNISLDYEPYRPGTINGPLSAAPAQVTVTPARPGTLQVSFTIPAFADGAAYNLTISP